MRFVKLAFFMICSAVPCYSRTITVDPAGSADYTSIQTAIDNAMNGDVVELRPATYYEKINFSGKAITVKSTDPTNMSVVYGTIINGGSSGNVVTFESSEKSDSIILGITIEDANCGIYCYHSSPTIQDCVIRYSKDADKAAIWGDVASPKISGCFIGENSNVAIKDCDGSISNSQIWENTGGIYNCDGLITDCNIINNTGCGLEFCNGEIKRCNISMNTSYGISQCNGQIRNCVISQNLGGIFDCTPTEVLNTLITGNKNYGIGELRRGRIANCTIVGNQSSGIYCTSSGITLVNNIIVSNGGYGIITDGGNVTLKYNNVWGNTSGNYSGISSGITDNHLNPLFAIDGNWDGNNNWVEGDYHLKSIAGRWTLSGWVNDTVTSPCIDAGDPSSAYFFESAPNGTKIDQGCFGGTTFASKSPYGPDQYCTNFLPGDTDFDCKIDFKDFANVAAGWLSSNFQPYLSRKNTLPAGSVLDENDTGIIKEYDTWTWTKIYGSNWTVSRTTNPGEYLTGTGGAKLVSTTGVYMALQKDFGAGTELDLSGKFVRIRYYVSAEMAASSPDLYINFNNGTNSSITTDQLSFKLPCKTLGWYTIDIPLAQFGNTGFVHAAKARICTVYIGFNVPTATTWFLDSVEFIPSGLHKARLSVQFDDGFRSSLTGGIAYMARYGFPSTFYITGRSIGQGSMCTWDEIKQAESLGAMICAHDQPIQPISTMTDQQTRDWCESMKQPLYDHGYFSGAEYFAIPGGTVSCSSPHQIAIFHEYFSHVRGVEPYYQQLPNTGPNLGSMQPAVVRYPIEPWWCGAHSGFTNMLGTTPAWSASNNYAAGDEVTHTINGVLCYLKAKAATTSASPYEPGVTPGWNTKWQGTEKISVYGKSYLDRLEAEKEIGIVFFHGFNNEIPGSPSPAMFKEWVDYLATKNIDVVAMDELFADK